MNVTGLGGLEMRLASLVVELDEQQADSAEAGRHAERAAHVQARARLEDMEDAAASRLASGVASGCAQIGAGAASIGGAAGVSSGQSSTQPSASQLFVTRPELFQAAGQLQSSALDFGAASADRSAERHKIGADELQSRAADMRESRERSRAFADKAMDHIAEIARARMDAQMAASRG